MCGIDQAVTKVSAFSFETKCHRYHTERCWGRDFTPSGRIAEEDWRQPPFGCDPQLDSMDSIPPNIDAHFWPDTIPDALNHNNQLYLGPLGY